VFFVFFLEKKDALLLVARYDAGDNYGKKCESVIHRQ